MIQKYEESVLSVSAKIKGKITYDMDSWSGFQPVGPFMSNLIYGR